MHIAMVTRFVDSPQDIGSGVAGISKYLTDEFALRKNIKVTIVIPKGIRGETVCEKWENCSVYKVGKKRLWSFLPGTVYDIFAGKRQITSLLRQINPDLVHFQGVMFLAAGCEQPHVLTIHGIVERDALWAGRRGLRWFKPWLLKFTEGYGRRRVPYIILISEYVKELLHGKNRIRKTWFIENPVTDSYFDIDWHFEPGRIFCCSLIVPRKNIIGMIKAFSLISQRFTYAQLRFSGGRSDPDYLRQCKDIVEKSNLQDKVHFLGNITTKEVQSELSRANCLLISSFQETAPLAIEEAMAVGVPVVGSRICGIPFLIEDGKTGYLIDPYDLREIADAVGKIIASPSLAHEMSQRAKEIARCRFKASMISEQILKVYHEILAESSKIS